MIMNTNECVKKLHAALVAKAKRKCEIASSNRLSLEIGGKLAEYGGEFAAAFSNDGILDDEEERRLNAMFDEIVDTYLPSLDDPVVDRAWNGFSIFFITVFKGVKNYLNTWFGLDLR